MQQRSVFVPKPCLEKVAKPDEPQLHISSDAPCLPKASLKKVVIPDQSKLHKHVSLFLAEFHL